MQKGPLSTEMFALHSERVRVGQARARAAGRLAGRPIRYPDALIRVAMQCHEAGETWTAVAVALGISLDRLYARVRKLRREDARAPDETQANMGSNLAALPRMRT